jgi:hypothetical protein
VDGKPVDYWWSLVSPGWMDATKPKGVNAYHMRLGPTLDKDLCCGNQGLGGPYAADGWNPKFWARVHEGLQHAGKIGSIVEVDVTDGWIIKHSIQGDFAMPWPAADVTNAAVVPLNPSVIKWINKATYEVCNYGNVILQVSNEGDLIPGWTPALERAMHAAIRAGEKQPGCVGVIHMIGSNTRDFDGPYDYFESHSGSVEVTQAGRPVMVNEYNPSISPATFHERFCAMKAAGSAFWYWRSDGSDADQDASLNSLNCDAPPATSCTAPLPDRSKLTFAIGCNKINGVCDVTPQVYASCEYCATIGMGTYNGQVRCSCPMRNECGATGHPTGAPESFQCDQRLPCEQYAMQAAKPVLRSDGTVNPLDDYGFRFTCNGCSYVEACNGDQSTCSRVPYP